jgi:spore maturation protein CgeB
MKILFISDAYMQNGDFDPYRESLINFLQSISTEILVIKSNSVFCSNSAEINNRIGYEIFVDEIRQFKADLVFSINRAGLTKEVRQLFPNTKIITWFIDSYERVDTRLLEFDSKDVIWLTGTGKYKERFCELYGVSAQQIVHTPFGFDSRFFHDQKLQRDIDVSFVGTSFGNDFFPEFVSKLDRNKFKSFVSIYGEHKEQYKAQILDELNRADLICPESSFASDYSFWQSVIDDQISIENRLSALSALSSYNLQIFGEPIGMWLRNMLFQDSNLLERFNFRKISTATELSTLYNTSLIALNIQHHQAADHSLAIRVFDVMACKALLVTNHQSKKPLQELGFVENEDFVSYENPADLKQKVSFYLGNNFERERIVDSAFSKALKEHSMDARINKSLELSGVVVRLSEVKAIKRVLSDSCLKSDPSLFSISSWLKNLGKLFCVLNAFLYPNKRKQILRIFFEYDLASKIKRVIQLAYLTVRDR